VYLVDRDRRILFWNDGAERITGYRAQEVIGRFCHNNILMHCDHEERLLCGDGCPLLQTIHDGHPREAEVFLRHKDGHRVPVCVRSVPVRDADGAIIGAAESFEELQVPTKKLVSLVNVNAPVLTDGVTGLPNRVATLAELKLRVNEFIANRTPFHLLAIAICDLDRFRQMYGAQAVHSVLHTTAQTIRRTLGADEFVGRWAEEQFLAILCANALADVEHQVDGLHRLVSLSGIQWWGETLAVTIVSGVAMVRLGDTAEDLIQRADEALRVAPRGTDEPKTEEKVAE
jgi:diguanylate cyclase (GGDEF)-like protein/PAS domain S-box-containing protein